MFGFGSSNKKKQGPSNKLQSMMSSAKESKGLGPSSAPSVDNESVPRNKKKNMMKSAVGSLFK